MAGRDPLRDPLQPVDAVEHLTPFFCPDGVRACSPNECAAQGGTPSHVVALAARASEPSHSTPPFRITARQKRAAHDLV